MHGRQRAEYKALQRDTKVAAKLAGKAVAWHQLQAALLEQRRLIGLCGGASSGCCNEKEEDEDAEAGAGVAAAVSAESTLQLIEKAVTVNPDPIWLWNFRRELIEKGRSENDDDDASAAAAAAAVWERERVVTQAALSGNPKAYAAWHHRKWCLQQYLLQAETAAAAADATLQQELELTALFFLRDERNFHCWSYRRFVVSCCLWWSNANRANAAAAAQRQPPTGEWSIGIIGGDPEKEEEEDFVWMGAQIASPPAAATAPNRGPPPSPSQSLPPVAAGASSSTAEAVLRILQAEWDFTELKIRDNFSNFSAFHYRSKMLPLRLSKLLARKDENSNYLQSVVAAEFELVANAVFTEPDDQTAWWYQRFLLDFMKQQQHVEVAAAGSWYREEILLPHLEQLRELQQETASKSKWVLLGVLQCLQYSSSSSSDTVGERRSILGTLIEIDSDRKERYRHLLRQLDKD